MYRSAIYERLLRKREREASRARARLDEVAERWRRASANDIGYVALVFTCWVAFWAALLEALLVV
jgi:hypothetical protein